MRKNILKIFIILLSLNLNLIQTHASLIFNNEVDGTHENIFFLDSGDTALDFIDLEFGTINTAKIRFDIVNSKFIFNRDLDLSNNQIKNLSLENLSVTPTCDGTFPGKIYYNTVDNKSYTCNGTTWVQHGGVGKFVDGTNVNNAVYNTGNVGINTLTPAEKLDIRGNINIAAGTALTTTQDFEAVTFPPAPWTVGGTLNWVRDTVTFQQGLAAAASGTITHNQTSFIDRNITFTNAGEVRFFWKVGSETNFDYLLFCLDNDACTRTAGFNQRISGNINWVEVVVPVTAGAHSFRWVYAKDGSVSTGADKGYLDNVRFIEGSNDGNLYVQKNIGLGITTPTNPIQHSSGALLTVGGVWTNASDRNLKENIEEVDKQEILEKIINLPISKWNYKVENSSIKHIGPMAQDFYGAFQLGASEKSISTIDEPSVALIGVQALYEKIKILEEKINKIEEKNSLHFMP